MNATALDPLVGRLIEKRYRIDAHLADGGMGRVYVAHDLRLERDVALKVLRADLARDPLFVERFQREARSAARLSHPHVVGVHDQGRDGDVVFLAMELVRGTTMRDVIRAGGVPVGHLLGLFDQLLDGLSAAHRAGFIHRDIKPENILIDARSSVKIADFGLARAVAGSGVSADNEMLIGTASYLSPEQVDPARFGVDGARSDVYSAGLVLFEMLTGRRAFDGDLPLQVAYQHVHEAVAAPSSLSPKLAPFDAFVAHATAKTPARRPVDAAAMREALSRLRPTLPPETLAFTPMPAPSLTARTAHMPDAASNENPHSTGTKRSGAHPASRDDDRAHTQRLPDHSTQQMPRAVAPPKAPRRRWPWFVALGALAASLTAAAVLGLGLGQGKTVPMVHSRPQGEAVQAVRNAGFDVSITNVASDTVPIGQVVASTPAEGSKHSAGTLVQLTVSTGPRLVSLPNVVGQTLDEARSQLKLKGLRAPSVTQRPDASASGTVLSMTPTAPTSVRHDATVALVVSSGPQQLDLPDLAGTDEAAARKQLEAAGLTVTTHEDYSPDQPAGKVVSTNPSAGSRVQTGDTVDLTISKGVEMVDVPDVVGMSGSDARDTLEAAGFEVSGGSWIDDLLDHTVTSQSPRGGVGHQAAKGSSVELSF